MLYVKLYDSKIQNKNQLVKFYKDITSGIFTPTSLYILIISNGDFIKALIEILQYLLFFEDFVLISESNSEK